MRVDRAARRVEADLPTVFTAFTDAERLAAWLPPEGMTGRLERFDPRAGGGFRMVLSYDEPPPGGGKADASSDVVEAHIAELDPAGRLVWQVKFPSEDPAAAGLMTMTWTLSPADDGTLVSVAAVDVPAAISPEAHAEGLRSSLAQLAAAVDRR